MDSTDNLSVNLPARLPVVSSRLPAQVSVAPRELTLAPASPAPSVNSRMLFRGLARHWWHILLIWLIISAPLSFLVYRFIEPTYQAYSMIKVESNQPELFDHSIMARDGSQPSYLLTEAELLKTSSVLELALQDANLRTRPMIQHSEDPEADLRKKLDVQIIPNTQLIRVAIESKDPYEACAIVNAVVDAYNQSTVDSGVGRTSLKGKSDVKKILTEALKVKDDDLWEEIQKKRKQLREYAEKGTVEFNVPPRTSVTRTEENDQEMQSVFDKESLEIYKTTKEHLMQTEFQIMELEAQLAAKKAEGQPGQTGDESPEIARKEDLRDRIIQEFRRDPDVASLTEQIKATTEELEHLKGVVRKGADPGRVALHRKLEGLKKDYNQLWETKSEQIHQRLLVTTSASGEPRFDTLADIKSKLESLKFTKSKLTDLINKFHIEKKAAHTDAVDVTFLRDDLSRDYSMYDQIHRKLESLKFSEDKANIHIGGIEPAKVPKVPNKNKRFMYTALLPVGVLFAVVGLFLLFEVRAERVGDPDMLSSRVQSEVYALPPLPTARTARKLNGPTVDDQIERFIQRLDHLRFAVCGDQHATEMGRCVLVTSAVGGEGKTTLAAQLAARCGNAGVSTLLIDADLRRASLCPLLDVPEGPGLSDVLEGARFEDVVIPVQGGTFHLLCAGTPIQDTSRLFQGRNLAMLIAQLRQSYELIFIDSPPVLPVPDALILGRWADGALLAARYEISRSPQVERARRQLDNAGIPVLGTVINGMRSSDAYYGRYSYGRQRATQAEPDPSSAT